MAALAIPSALRAAAARPDSHGLREWVTTLPAVVAELAGRWRLRLGAPYEPGGQCSWVAPAGERLVLKVGWRHVEAEHEADALRLWAGDGAVLLHDAATFDQTSALLLERCAPGTPLGAGAPEPEQDVVLAGLLHRLWIPPPTAHPFRELREMCESWATEFEQRYPGAGWDIDPGIALAAIAVLRELPGSARTTTLLCTDLHAGNALAAQRAPWLVIDPKPYVGDRTYDALQHMLNCAERLAADPDNFTRRMAGLLDLDAGRLRRWLFARCVQECLDDPPLYDIAVRLAP